MATVTQLHVGLLGPLIVATEHGEIVISARRQRALLSLLALHAPSPVSTDQIAEAFWGEDQPDAPLRAIRFHVSKLRSALGDASEHLETVSSGYRLRLEEDGFDIWRFDRLVKQGRAALADGDPKRASESLRSALDLWRGQPFDEVAFEEFAVPEVRRLSELRLAGLEARIAADLALGHHGDVVEELFGLVEQYPLREELEAHLMVALYRTGRQAEALRAYGVYCHRLGEDLGLDPSGALRSLEESILLDSLPEVSATPVRLRPPVPVGELVGRDETIGSLSDALNRRRLVTITGPPGVGKTHMALAAVNRVATEKGLEAVYVDVIAGGSPDVMAQTVARALGVEGGMRQATSAIGGTELVLVVDGCERALADVRSVVADTLLACPNLVVVATSRTPLDIGGESLLVLSPLDTTDELSDAVVLFSDRAGLELERLAPHEVEQVLAICRSVAGLPLGLEILGARARTLGLEGLADMNLDGGSVEAPVGGLQGAIRWSVEALEAEALEGLQVLAALETPFDLEDARALDVAPGVVAKLVEASLVTPPDRYSRHAVLAPSKRLVWEDMASEARESVLGTHFDWCVSTLSDIDAGASTSQRSPDDAEILSAMSWALESRREAAWRLAATVGRVWWAAGRTESARQILARTVDDLRSDEASAEVEETLWFSAQYALAAGDLEAAARDISRHGDIAALRMQEREAALHAQLQAGLLSLTGRFGAAIEHQATSLRILEGLDDPEATYALASHAYLLARCGHTEEAVSEVARLGASAARWDQAIAGALRERVLGWCALWEGAASRAQVHLASALAIFEMQGNVPGLVTTQRDMAWLAIAGGDAVQAVDHAQAALRASGDIPRLGTDRMLHCILAVAWSTDAELTLARSALGRALEGLDSAGPVEDLVWTLRAAASIDASAGQTTRATVLAAFSDLSLGELDVPYPPVLEEWWADRSAGVALHADAVPDAQRAERLMLAAEVAVPLPTD